MIRFACQQFSVEQVVRCSLGLSRAEYRVLEHLLVHCKGFCTANQVASILTIDVSTAQRSLKRLHEKGALVRSQNNLAKGGYQFSYRVVPKAHIARLVMQAVDGWSKRVHEQLERW